MTGAKELAAAFRNIAPGLDAPINASLRKALRPMLAAAKRNTPHKKIRKALTIKTDRTARKDRPTAVVGGNPKNPDYRLLHLSEFGTKPHKIGDWMHPGAKAEPFLRPAFEEKKDETIKILGEEIGPAIEKQAAKVAAKRAKK
jgi:HK97 gp10 family phage protein